MQGDTVIPESQVNSGGTFGPPSHKFPVRDQFFDWHQGTEPKWKSQDSYAEYVSINGMMSMVDTKANRIYVKLDTVQTNERRYNDWKGYDDIQPTINTYVYFNGIQVYAVRAYPADRLRHLIQVDKIVTKLQQHSAFGWWQPEDIDKVNGMKVGFKGMDATITDVRSCLNQGAVILDCPGYESDYFDSGWVKDDIISDNIDWLWKWRDK
jgi:hypothetical protein